MRDFNGEVHQHAMLRFPVICDDDVYIHTNEFVIVPVLHYIDGEFIVKNKSGFKRFGVRQVEEAIDIEAFNQELARIENGYATIEVPVIEFENNTRKTHQEMSITTAHYYAKLFIHRYKGVISDFVAEHFEDLQALVINNDAPLYFGCQAHHIGFLERVLDCDAMCWLDKPKLDYESAYQIQQVFAGLK